MNKKFRTAIIILIVLVGLLAAGLPLLVSFVDKTAAAEAAVTRYQQPNGQAFWQISAGPANAWMLSCDGGYLLIDTGYPVDYERFKAGLAKAGLPIGQIRYLFVTHAHDEHAGFAARLKRETSCRLILPQASLAGLASGTFVWKGHTVNPSIHVLGLLYNLIKKRDFRFEPVIPAPDDILLAAAGGESATPLGLDGRFLPTPGHSRDSWSLVLENGLAIVGDAAMNYLNAFGAGYRPIFMEDRKGVYASFDLIRQSGAQLILSGHGPAFAATLLPMAHDQAAAGPGMASLGAYLAQLAPGFLLIFLLLFLGRQAPAGYRIALYIFGFILMRDLMTPFAYWSFGSEPVFWLRFAADPGLLCILAAASLALSLGLIHLEGRRELKLIWFTGSWPRSVLVGMAGALLVAAPVVLPHLSLDASEHGGLVPAAIIPAILALGLCGNLLEELLFRGFLRNRLESSGLQPLKAALASGLAFGLCHAPLAFTVSSVGWPLLLFATWEGCLCGLLAWRYGLAAAVVCHGLAITAIAIL